MKKIVIGATSTTPKGVRYTDRYGRCVQTQASFAQLCREAEEEREQIWG